MSVQTDVANLRAERERLLDEANTLTEGVGHSLRRLTPEEKVHLDELLDRAADLLDEIRALEGQQV